MNTVHFPGQLGHKQENLTEIICFNNRCADNNETLEDMVLFWTGCPSLPPDVTTKLLVKYLENHPSKVLAESSTCTLELSIPVVHNDYSVFKDYLNKSISYGKLGFGKIQA